MMSTLHPKLTRFSIADDLPEKLSIDFDDILTQIISTVCNFLQYLIDLFNKEFPPETPRHWSDVVAPYLLAGVSFLTCLFVFHCFFSCISSILVRCLNAVCSCFPCFGRCLSCEERSEERMMIGPGRSPWMLPRSVFEANPRGYFRDLRRQPNDFAYSTSHTNWYS